MRGRGLCQPSTRNSQDRWDVRSTSVRVPLTTVVRSNPSYTGLTMCMGPDSPRSEDDRRAISEGLRRYWKSEDGQAARFARKHAARQSRLARAKALLTASEAASKQ